MDKRLHRAPCGYLVFNKDWDIIMMNDLLRNQLHIKKLPIHLFDILSKPSQIYFQTYFTPAITIHGKVREMYLKMKSIDRKVPILMNVNEHNGLYECILIQVRTRDEYESQLLNAKKDAVKTQREMSKANEKLNKVLKELEYKQQILLKVNNELQSLATIDELTELYNRRVFNRELTAALERQYPFSLAILDIDFFKKVNDTYGHQIGDKVLQELAYNLKQYVKTPHIVARFGGEEFVIIYYSSDEDAQKLVQQLHANLNKTIWGTIPIKVSIGITSRIATDTYAEIYERADRALYVAKQTGRNRVVYKSVEEKLHY